VYAYESVSIRYIAGQADAAIANECLTSPFVCTLGKRQTWSQYNYRFAYSGQTNKTDITDLRRTESKTTYNDAIW